jgi:hypothetical protein
MKNTKVVGQISIGAVILAAAGLASAGSISYTAEADMGVIYDTNVAVEGLEFNSSEGDTGLRTALKLGASMDVTENTAVKVKYSLLDKRYENFSELGTQTHILSGDVSGKVFGAKLGAAVYHVESLVDDENYLSMTKVNPYASTFIGGKYYARVDVSATQKEFETATDRDAEQYGVGGSVYRFIGGSKHYVSVGYDYKVEDAEADIYDYESHEVKAGWTKKMDIYGSEMTMKVGGKYEDRQYDSPASAGTDTRYDKRSMGEASLEYAVSKHAHVSLSYEYSNYESNLASQDYHQQVAAMGVGIKF